MLANDQKLVSPAIETPTKSSQQTNDAQTKRKIETEGAVWDSGVITLKGNPLETTKQIYCPQCHKPRLLYPLMGAGSRMPDDPDLDYCNKHPFVLKQGLDIFGQPFPSADGPPKGKKEKDLLKQQRAEKDSTPASQNSGADGKDEEVQSVIAKLAPQGKGQNYIPWHTCPKCKRSLLITRFAQHLEKCMGISGRLASRNAMAKMSGPNGSIGSTPMGSRPGTPGPTGSQGESNGKKRERDDDEADELDDVPLKKMKRAYIKKADRERMAAESTTSSQNGDKEGKESREKGGEKELIKLKIKPPLNGTSTKDKDTVVAKKPPKPGGDDAKKDKDGSGIEESPSKKLKKIVSNSSGSS